MASCSWISRALLYQAATGTRSNLIYRLLTGEKRDSAELDEEYAQFIGERLLDIESIFSGKRIAETKKRLVSLERLRAKEMFG